MVASIFSTQQPAFRFANITYEAEATALFARMTPEPDPIRKYYINQCIKSIKNTGAWSLMDVLYITAGHSAQASRLNWKSSSYTLTPVNSPTFTVDRGYTGDGSTSYLSSTYNPSAGGFNLVQNSGHMGAWIGTNVTASGQYDCGNAYSNILSRTTASAYGGSANTNSFSQATGISTSIGHTLWNRTASTSGGYYRNGSLSTAFSTTTVALRNAPILVGCVNNSSTGTVTPSGYSTRRVQAVHCGAQLTATQIADVYAAINTYMTAIGAV